ncbi:MAG: bis(5'-nucleosyl)-tetraphosphatase (symmetrical) YqeK [Candidatus Margulisiibacteriota bacterium]
MTVSALQPPLDDRLRAALTELLSETRLAHSVRVSDTAYQLAQQLGFSPDDCQRVQVAGLLHDAAKQLTPESLAGQMGCAVSECLPDLWAAFPSVWHAYAGPALAQRRWGISDPIILDAMRYHTTGNDQMTPVAKVVFVADFVEPGRTLPIAGYLAQLAVSDLDSAVYGITVVTLRNLIVRQFQIHPATLACYNAALKAVSPERRQAILTAVETS